MIDVAIAALVERRDLLPEEAHAAMMQVMSGDASPAQISAFVIALPGMIMVWVVRDRINAIDRRHE